LVNKNIYCINGKTKQTTFDQRAFSSSEGDITIKPRDGYNRTNDSMKTKKNIKKDNHQNNAIRKKLSYH
jgi:hypothetical protein